MTEIILDAGHGGFDNGATYEGEREKDQTLRLAIDVGARLEQEGYLVKYIRTEDVYESPYQKAEKANALGGDFFISFHRNYSLEDNRYSGGQALVNSLQREEAVALGRELVWRLEQVGFDNLGVEEVADLIVLRETQMPAVLLEVGFMNSEKDRLLWNENYDKVVEGIVAGIKAIAPLSLKEAQAENTCHGEKTCQEETDSPQSFYHVQTGLFKHELNAVCQLERLQMLGYVGCIHYEKPYYGVWIGREDTLERAVHLQKQLRRDGFQTLIVTY